MADPKYLDDLTPKQRGQRITHQEYNAIIAGRRESTSMRVGSSDGGQQSIGTLTQATERNVWAKASETIPAYSIFGIIVNDSPYNSEFSKPARVTIAKIGTTNAGSHLTLYTNGPIELKEGWNYIKPISLWDTVELTFSGTAPTVGQPCGVKPDTYTVEANRYGLVCVGPGSTEETVTLARAVEPAKILAEVTEYISAASGKTLGSGKVKILARPASSLTCVSLKDAETGETPWELDAYNARERAYNVGDLVECSNALGIGLLVDYGKTDTSSSSSSSGSQQCMVSSIEGVDATSLPIVDADDIVWLVGITSDGCVVRAPADDCPEGA